MQSDAASPPSPDTNLIQRARQGDNGSITWLFERYQPVIYRYLYYRTGEQQAAEDLTSEVFVRMLRALPAYRPQAAPFQSWLFQIARNLVTDYYRQSGRSEALSDDLQAPGPIPEAVLEHAMTHDRLRQALSRLKGHQREVIILRFILEVPIAQVAGVLGTSEDAVKGLQRRALLTLRRVMLAEDQQPAVHELEAK